LTQGCNSGDESNIMADMHAPQSVSSAREPAIRPYRPRHLRFIRRQALGDWRIKVYSIMMQGRAPRGELIEPAVSLAAKTLPQPAQSEERPGIGFVIAHDAATVCFGLVYWWQSANELHQRAFVSPLDDPGAFRPIEYPAAGCVWELGIIDFERRAWLEDVLANPTGPDINRYLGRELNADV
jgi:hypothetical protein